MIQREAEEKQQLQYFSDIEKMFIDCTQREVKKSNKNQVSEIVITTVQPTLAPVESLVRLFNQERLFNLANELSIIELREQPITSIQKKTEEKYGQIFNQIQELENL